MKSLRFTSFSCENQMHCPFCKKVAYPVNSDFNAPVSRNSQDKWMCFHCPNVVKFTTPDNNYSILCFGNEHWYEVTWLRDSKKYIIHQYITTLAVEEIFPTEYWSCYRKLVLKLDSEETITPENIKSKLGTILVFL
jgi:hypothetical protein